MSIQTGYIVWVNGPFECGSYPDIKIFWKNLKSHLDPNEFVEADAGYHGEPTCTRTPTNIVSLADK